MRVVNPHGVKDTQRLANPLPGGVLFSVAHGNPPAITMTEYPLPAEDKLKALQAAVHGNIEHVHIGPSRHRKFVTYDAWINEDGRDGNLPFGLCIEANIGGGYIPLPIAGNVLITAGESLSGETVPLTLEEMRDICLFTMHDGLPIVAVIPEHPDA
jgi:hypothetical protein